MADWSLLRHYLGEVAESVRLTWPELDRLVGGVPPSAAAHRAWWSGDRPHVRAWRSAGFTITNLQMGREVTFVRTGHAAPSRPSARAATPTPSARDHRPRTESADIVLVTCVKSKLSRPAPARDLYTSSQFRKQREYAERTGLPWYILSAEHGLVAPEEWLAPYDRYLPETPATYRAAWGSWVAARLELLAGSLRGKVVEVHAGSAYLDAVRPHLEGLGAVVTEPLQGLSMYERPGWYATHQGAAAPVEPSGQEPAHLVALLRDIGAALTVEEFLAAGRNSATDRPGLYSWWVDDAGAGDLSRGLGLVVEPGLIYAGLAGATRYPSGSRSTNTLWSRITTMHLGGNHQFSTFRRSLGATLAQAAGADRVDEASLNAWMHRHLMLVTVPWDDADTLGRMERSVLAQLDPPLNLQHVRESPMRRRLTELRARVS